MSVAAAAIAVAGSDGHAARRRAAGGERFDWTLLLLAFLVIAAILIGKAAFSAGKVPLLNDTDDAMRLATVRDLLAGQGWFDHLQYRLDTPYGAEIHWSHLVDAAVGGLVLLFRPLAGGMAETFAVYTWPLLLLLALLTLSARLAFRLAGRAAILPAVVLPAVSPELLAEFSPGRIDHHSIQILLTLLMAWTCIEALERPRLAIPAGLAAALSLAIGIEGLPSIVCAVLAVALAWVLRPAGGVALRSFGLAFGLATLLLLATAYPPDRWLQPACDELSVTYAALAVGVGAVLVLLSVLPLGGWRPWQRLALGGGLAAALGLGLALAFPLCLRGPYAALDPWLVHNWLDNIAEAKPVWQSLASLFDYTFAIVVPPVLGLAVVAVRLRAPRDRGAWAILGLFLLVAVAVMCVQVRGARLAMPLAVPAAAWLILRARQRYLDSRRISAALAMLASWAGFSGTLVLLALVLAATPFDRGAPAAAASQTAQNACRLPTAFADLARLPPARVMAPIDLGSHLLVFTPHSVVAAPYHRDQDGVLDTFHFFNEPIGKARAILAARGVTLVVVCPALPEMRGLADAAPDSFVRLYAAGTLPAWLQPIGPPDAVLRVFRVVGS